MRVALDTNALYTTRAGVARYVRGLQHGFATLASPELELVPLAWPVENFAYAQPQRMLKTAWRELVWAKWTAPAQLQRDAIDLLHSTALPLIRRPVCPHVVTLHDVALLRHPWRFRSWQRRSGLRRLQEVAAADHVISVSQFTADEAMAMLDIPAKKITVVSHGVTLAETEKVPADLPPEFFLFVGSLEPGKNLKLLREVWLTAEQRGHALPPLLIVGARWAGVPGEGAPPASWRYLGHQSDEVLLALYRRARALLFPSTYEGFGLPVLEAMAAGCPVICGRVASLPEVGGEAVRYAELNAPGFSAAVAECLANEELREAHITAGRARAAEFDWESCARETLKVYRMVAGRS